MKIKKFYITTAVDYVNSPPHVGHAFEKTLADAIARWKRLQGDNVYFLTGVDENAQKNVEAAEKAGVQVKTFIDKNAEFFLELCKKLNLSNDDFIRTTDKQHVKVVQKIVQKMIDKKDIYKGEYTGLYCVGCETYYTEKDLVDGKCPEHKKEPEKRTEEAYFFKLSKYKKELLKLIPKYVVPKSRVNEVISRINEDGLIDICVSRKGAKWGIDFPNDKNFKVWVWIDALINYISGLKDKEKIYWPANVHVVGKGINWFHSVIWPSILISAGYKLPEKLLVHGYLNISGEKISKSLGNVIDPLILVDKYGADSVRYSFLKCSVFDDSDYSEEILITRNNNELADKLGNLVSRVSTLAEKYGIKKIKNSLLKKLKLEEIEKHMENYELDRALNEIFAFVDVCNEYVQNKKPWETHDKKVLYELADSIKAIAILLWSFIPSTSEKIAKQFGFKIGENTFDEIEKPLKVLKIKKSEILFKKIEYENIKEPKINKSENTGIVKMSELIQYPEWQKLDLRVAQIKKVEDIDGADKLYKLTLDVGQLGERIICAGIKQFYKKEELKNRKIVLFANLTPRMMMGVESQGMLLAASNEDHSKVVLIFPDEGAKPGMRIG